MSAYEVIGSQNNERFILALVVSLTLHMAILAIKSPLRLASKETGTAGLTVTFLGRDDALPEIRKAKSQRVGTPRQILTQESPSRFKANVQDDSQPKAKLEPIGDRRPDKATTEILLRSKSDAGKAAAAESRYVHKPGEARVLLEVNSDGQIGQIIWDMLPALTDEQFNRLEAAIRARGHPGPSNNNFVKETINVRDYIDANP